MMRQNITASSVYSNVGPLGGKQMRTLYIVLLCSVSCSALADCYVVENMSGFIAANVENYKIVNDGMKGRKFYIQINGQGSSVIPSDLKCMETSTMSVLCMYNEAGQSTVETWAVDPEKKKAYYTQTRSGFGLMNNAKLLVGDLVGRCP